MQDLRLVGVHEDGEHLLLNGPGGAIFRLHIDEALRVATAHHASRTARGTEVAASSADTPAPSPRDIQQRIRAGASAEEVAEATGASLESIRKYEGPILAEREHIAQLAQAVRLPDTAPDRDDDYSTFHRVPTSLGGMVQHRLATLGVDPDTLTWDAWRRHDGQWTVAAYFAPPSTSAQQSIGEPPPAQWLFHPGKKVVRNVNRWSQILSEIDEPDAPIPARRLSAVADRPFNIEDLAADQDARHDPLVSRNNVEPDAGADPESLLEVLNFRRGQRLGADEDDALAVLLDDHDTSDETSPHSNDTFPLLKLTQKADGMVESSTSRDAPATPDDSLRLITGASPNTREIRISVGPQEEGNEKTESLQELAHEEPIVFDLPETSSRVYSTERRKVKRANIPSWDEIVFGTRNE